MLFNSLSYIAFFVVVLTSTYTCNLRQAYRCRNVILLLASYFFYGQFHLWFIFLLLYVTIVSIIGGRMITKAQNNGKSGKQELIFTLFLTLGCLFIFKYAYIVYPSIILPIGLSFFIFQALSYPIDIFRKKIHVHDWTLVALFIAFFPTILSGPIERARNLLPQLENKFQLSWTDLSVGCQLFIWGLFKKVVIADRLAVFVDEIYYSPNYYTGSTLALAAFFYSFQIYADFSGYADMAIGSARMMGIRLSENFYYPYFAKTIKDFWHRWHISLTSWFTEYVYFSMGGNRVRFLRWVFNIITVFLLSGIWHGATFSFIIWGGMHATLYLTEHFLSSKKPNLFYQLYVFVMITFAWVFFRLTDSGQAWRVVTSICTSILSPVYLGSSTFSTMLTSLLLVLYIGREWLLYHSRSEKLTAIESVFVLLAIMLFGIHGNQFVYFQF